MILPDFDLVKIQSQLVVEVRISICGVLTSNFHLTTARQFVITCWSYYLGGEEIIIRQKLKLK